MELFGSSGRYRKIEILQVQVKGYQELSLSLNVTWNYAKLGGVECIMKFFWYCNNKVSLVLPWWSLKFIFSIFNLDMYRYDK